MLKNLLLFITILAFSRVGYCQTREIVDREIVLIRQISQRPHSYGKQHPTSDKHYKNILKLDTLAIYVLIDKISDTTQTQIPNVCSTNKFKIGDIAFYLLNDIVSIHWTLTFGGQWDSYSCGVFPDGGWEYLSKNREQFQEQLRAFFKSRTGNLYVRLLKSKKLTKAEYDSLVKEIFNSDK